MSALQTDLTQGSVSGKLLRYAAPLVASSLLQAVYSITDIIIAGHFIGDAGISAINTASVIMNMLTQLAIGLTVGGNILVGRYFGSGAEEDRKQAAGAALATVTGQGVSVLMALCFSLRHREMLGLTLRHLRPRRQVVSLTLKLGLPVALQWTIASVSWLVVLTLAMAAVIILLAELLAPWLVTLFTPDPEVQRWAVVNLRIEIICQLFYAGMFSYNTLATGSGHTVFIMWNSFLNCIVVRLVLAVVLEHFMGICGVYLACGIAVSSSVPVGW